MRLPDRLRLPVTFDPGLLARDLALACAGGWTPHFVRQNYEGEWSVIALRAPEGARHPVTLIYSDPTAKTFVDTPVLESCPYFRQVLDHFACTLRAARLMRLAPGSHIREHADPDLAYEDGTVRIHIPILTNADVEFRLNATRVDMEAGSVWYLRLSDPHAVWNRGACARVHLVIDATVNDRLAATFAAALEQDAQSRAAVLPPRETIGFSCG